MRAWLLTLGLIAGSSGTCAADEVPAYVTELVDRMTLEEKLGQLNQRDVSAGITEELLDDIRAGRIGSLLNGVDVETVNTLQRTATEESRLGVPLLMARDVIHGFRTIFPLPLGQAATFNDDAVERAAAVAAVEAASTGVNWTFAPMIDITRDPRWGRIAESLGEDPLLASRLGSAMVRGFQGDDLSAPGSIAACAKHFAGYGASEAGRDYNTTNIALNELHNVYLRPFHAAVDNGVATLMTSFSDLNGVPASGNSYLFKEVLRDRWDFDGFVVSDWASIEQMVDHGYAADKSAAAREAFSAGVDMEMVSTTYADHLQAHIDDGTISVKALDEAVTNILHVKYQLGLFDGAITVADDYPQLGNADHLALAQNIARQSLVLLQNNNGALPLDRDQVNRVAVVGPLADAPHEQMGTWVFDGDASMSVTPLTALREQLADAQVEFVPALASSRARTHDNFYAAVRASLRADVTVAFVGEESIISGEAHSRADITLPGDQVALIEALADTGRPLIVVVLAGRPLTLENVLKNADAVLYAWHPGTMGGPAIADVLLGTHSPSGRLPVTWPKAVGQIPIYYYHKNTGKPGTPETYVAFDDLPVRGFQAAYGMSSHHLDTGYTPRFPFGFGLTYSSVEYSDPELSATSMSTDGSITASVTVTNTGTREVTEVVQLYTRDLVGELTRPVRELQDYRRVTLPAGTSREVEFTLDASQLGYYGADTQWIVEPGQFQLWISPDAASGAPADFSMAPTAAE